MAKNYDIVFVRAHQRGYGSGYLYPVQCYWRGNGSAYKGKGPGGCPVHVIRNHYGNFAETREDGSTFKTGDILINGKRAADTELNQFIRKNCGNVPTPEMGATAVERAMAGSKFADEEAMRWLEFDDYALQINACIIGMTDGKKVYDCSHGTIRPNEKIDIMHQTAGGSTFAIEKDNTISCVHAKSDTDPDYSERQLIEKARTAGGDRMNAYAQDHQFMTQAGFVPVAWRKVDISELPENYDASAQYEQPTRIYYAHASKCQTKDIDKAHGMTLDEWKKQVAPVASDNEARANVDSYIKGERELTYKDDIIAARKKEAEARANAVSHTAHKTADTEHEMTREEKKEARRKARQEAREMRRDMRFPMPSRKNSLTDWGEEVKPKKRGRKSNEQKERERQEKEWVEACEHLDQWEDKMANLGSYDEYEEWA